MPRINIEDDLETHPEFWRLFEIVKDRDACLGKLVRLFRLAQKRYGYDQELTLEDLQYHSLEVMIKSGWVRPSEKENVFEVPSSWRHFDWYRQRVIAGGKSASASRKHASAENKNASAVSQHNKINDVNTTESQFRGPSVGAPLPPLTLTLTPSLTHNTNTNKKSSTRIVLDFDFLYKKYPKKVGKTGGMKTCKSQIKTQDDFNSLSKAIDIYAAQCKKECTELKYIKQFSTFMNCWRDYLDAPDPAPLSSWARTLKEERDGL